MATTVPLAIIGAGQAGLSVAYYLRRFGLVPGHDFVVFDRGPDAGGAWQHRWEALRLGDAHRVHDLPGMDELGLHFDTADRSRPARDVVREYYRRYEEHFGLLVQRPAAVTAVADSGGELLVSTTAPAYPEVAVRALVNATGTWGSPFAPRYPGSDRFRGRQLHTAGYRAAEEFAGQRVVVVGGGTSAIGFLLELEGVASELCWVARRPIDWVAAAHLEPEAGAAAVAQQDEAARAGRTLPSIVSGTGVPVSAGIAGGIERGLLVARPMFTSIEPDGVRFGGGTFFAADAIIWATGFRPELRHLSALGLRVPAGGVAVQGGVSAADPRIFFAGYGPQASIIGAHRAGRVIAREVVASLSRAGS